MFTKEQEEKERASVTEEENAAAVQDIYGDRVTDETEKMVNDSLILFAKELGTIPEEVKIGYLQALERCPEVVEQESSPIRFLRADAFDAQLAAARLAKYWNVRIALFGEDRAFLRMSVEGTMGGDARAFEELGDANHVLPRDEQGRAVWFTDKSRSTNERLSNNEQLRLFWYQAHTELEDISVQRAGFVVLANTRMTKLSHFNRGFLKAQVMHVREALPLKLRAIHSCHVPSFVSQFILPAFKIMLGKGLRLRLNVHVSGTLPQALRQYGIKEENMPVCIGGSYHFDHQAWLAFRRELESSA
jgi:hypothetical protein